MSVVTYFLYSLSKNKLVFAPVASAMTAVHRDHLIPASNAQWLEIQQPVSQGQIVSTDLPLLMDGQTHNYNNYKYKNHKK